MKDGTFTADRLLALYERVAEAEDVIPRLRRFVLDLAVRGKLVEQDPPDEPAAELMKRIAKEKARLVKIGAMKPSRPSKGSSEADRFELPFGWRWTSLEEICLSVTDGDHLPPPKSERGVPFLVIGDVRSGTINYQSERTVPQSYFDALDPIRKPRPGDILYTLVGSLGIPVLVREDTAFCVQRHIGILRPSTEIDVGFLHQLLSSEFVFRQADACATGIAQKTVPLSGLRGIAIPLPPLAEQQRIVAKVDELMALCDRLEGARAGREAMRDRLTAATLTRLTAPETAAETFPTHARFALQTLPTLTTRPDQIKTLRQTILNLAVRGKLVEQDPADEPAAELLKRLKKAQVAACVSEGLRSRLPVRKLARGDLWFDFPHSWELASFDELFVIVSGVTKGQKIAPGHAVEVPYLRVANVQRGHLDLSVIKNIVTSRSDAERYLLRPGDVLMTEGGDWDKLGRAAIWRDEIPFCIHQNHIFRVRPPSTEVLPEWVITYTNSLIGRAFFEEASKQTTNLASINMTQLRSCPFPLPPLAEQHRIVAKVDALMVLCDQLEASLTTATTTRSRLLEALLHEALAGAQEAA